MNGSKADCLKKKKCQRKFFKWKENDPREKLGASRIKEEQQK